MVNSIVLTQALVTLRSSMRRVIPTMNSSMSREPLPSISTFLNTLFSSCSLRSKCSSLMHAFLNSAKSILLSLPLKEKREELLINEDVLFANQHGKEEGYEDNIEITIDVDVDDDDVGVGGKRIL